MLVFRSFAIGLTAACLALLAIRPPVQVHAVHEHPHARPASADRRHSHRATPPAIVDVAPGVTPAQLPVLLRLAPGERIVSVDDAPVAGDLAAGMLLATRTLRSRQFLDLSVTGPAGERRVLVLLH